MALTDVLTGVAGTALSLLRPTAALDVVAVLGPGFSPIFGAARPLVASVFEDARIMEHPLETGAVIADHIVFQPTEIDLPLACVGELAYRSTYAAIRGAFHAGLLLTVSTRTGIYPNMVIVEMPHEETPNAFNAVMLRVRLREAKFVTPKTGLSTDQTQNASQSSTVKRGNQQTSTPNASQSQQATNTASQSGAGPTPSPKGSTLYQWFGGGGPPTAGGGGF